MKNQYDKHTVDAIPYEKDQLVWLDKRNIATTQPSNKLTHRRYGPFKIIKKIGASSYKLAIPIPWKQKRIHDTFHESLLKPYIAPYFPSQVVKEPDPPTIIEGEEHYDIEEVLRS